MMKFSVFPPSHYEPSDFSGAALQQDGWNDFSFQTQYHLYVDTPEFSGRIGAVKILKRGQESSDTLQLSLGDLGPLNKDWVSLGQDLDYYERLAGLPKQVRSEVLLHLRDALSNPEHAASFFEEEGWNTSLLRDVDWESFKQDAAVVLERDYNRVAQLGLN